MGKLGKVRIVTDSTADIPKQVRDELMIESVPLKVHFAADTYLDGVTIGSDEFYDKLSAAKELPTTSQPSPVDFVDVFKGVAAQDVTHIVSIHLASALSGTYQSAVLAKSLLEDKVHIDIIDSRSASYGLGMLAVAAARAAKEGKSAEEIVEIVQHLRERTKLYFIVDTLEYLQKGGRIGKAAALFGTLLNIKPILSIDDGGEVCPVDKVRGQKKAMNRIIELLQKDFAGKKVNATIAHSKSFETAEEMAALIKQHFDVAELSFTNIGPVIGTHVGKGASAIFMSPV